MPPQRLSPLVLLLAGCLGPAPATEVQTRAIVYGSDDRREYFDSGAAERTLMERSMVALIARRYVRRTPSGVRIVAPTIGERAQLCPGEAFAEQPAAAFCSGVLVDWDLVLTAGHCAHAIPLREITVVFGYHLRAPGELLVGEGDLYEVSGVAAELESQPGSRRPIDYAWLRLRGSVRPPRAPVAFRSDPTVLQRGEGLTFIGSGGGAPMKSDRGGIVSDAGEPWGDHLVASTDTVAGASGGGAFDSAGALVAVLEGGGPDYVTTPEGCNTAFRPDGAFEPLETFTRARRARDDLCAQASTTSTICRSDCGDPCLALPLDDPGATGCTSAGPLAPGAPPSPLPLLLLLALTASGRPRRRR